MKRRGRRERKKRTRERREEEGKKWRGIGKKIKKKRESTAAK